VVAPAGAAFAAPRAVTLRCMAVPKQKQSHARTTQRRSQHKISAPTYNACPQCHSPRLPHRVCPVCGSYKGREVVVPDRDDQLS
jgi:large subunit ribosomal protein L32